MSKELLNLYADVIEIAEDQSNDIYMTLKLLMFNTITNLNKVNFSEEYLKDIETNKEKYVGIPICVDLKKLLAGEYDKLTHLYNKKTGTFGSQMIGSLVDFKVEEVEGVPSLIGEARIMKRFGAACQAIYDLHSQNNLKFSYEMYAGSYKLENGIKYIDASDENALIGMAIVSNPAVVQSQSILLIAESIIEDINSQEQGGNQVSKIRNAERTMEDMFSDAQFHLPELAELDMQQIRRKIYTALKEMIAKETEYEWYDFDIVDQTMTYIVILHYSLGDLYKIDYSVSEDSVTLSNMRRATKTYNDIPNKEVQTAMEERILELEAQLATANSTIATLNTEVAEAKATITSKETEIASLNAQIVEVGEQLTAKDAEIASLTPYKEQIETAEAARVEAELAAKKTALKEKCEKILSAEEVTELAEAIESLDENKINSVLAAKYVAVAEAAKKNPKPEKTMITASTRMVDEISIQGSDVVSKYITRS